MKPSDLIEAFRAEVWAVGSELETAANVLTDGGASEGACAKTLETFAGQMERIGTTAELLGLAGLHQACAHICANAVAVSGLESSTRAEKRAFFSPLTQLLADYLAAPTDFSVGEKLVLHLAGRDAPAPIDEETSMALLSRLLEPAAGAEEVYERAERAKVASAQDVNLDLPQDLDQSLFDGFMQEAPGHVADFLTLVAKMASGQLAPEDMASAKRVVHTLKGSASIVGIKGIATLGHHVEDILEYLEESGVVPTPDLGNTLLDAAGCLEGMILALSGIEETPADAQQVLQAVLDWAHRIESGDWSASSTTPLAVAEEASPVIATENSPTVAAVATEEASSPRVARREQTYSQQDLRVPVEVVDDLFRLVGELSTRFGQHQDRVKQATQRSRDLLTQNLAVQKRLFELENIVDVRNFAKSQRTLIAGERLSGLDSLELDEYDELHSATRSLVEEIGDVRQLGASLEEDVAQLASIAHQQERLGKDLQYRILSTRMTPVRGIVSRLTRNVRQTCQATGRRAELVVDGDDILVDGDILNKLADPLLHILRNAVDHGIEPPDERAAAGKPDTGTIKLSFARRGQTVVVRCQDDGRGLNYTAIREKAIERGMLVANQEMSETELARIILLPGFSTRSKLTEISGRGVGLDVVRDRIQAMKGSLDIRSQAGRGCEIELRFQASLAVVHALLVRVNGQVLGVPSYSVEQALAPGIAEFVTIGEQLNVRYGKKVYPAHSLSELIGAGGALDRALLFTKSALLVRCDDQVRAIVVDAVVDARDLTTKPVSQYLRKVRAVTGLAVLGDGTVAPLIDIAELARRPSRALPSAAKTEEETLNEAPTVLVVDDSLSVRKSLGQLLGDAGYKTSLARDGFEAIETIKSHMPGVVLTDLEMPNMNGLELAAHLRADPVTAKIPIIMITSRSQDKHRQLAQHAGVNVYLTKPYSEQELLQRVGDAVKAEA